MVPFAILVGICLVFFYKTILFGLLPFPGDLLVSGYTPWNHESYGGYVAGAVPSKDQYFDVLRELYPWKTLVINQVKQLKFPLWNPYNFSGAPLLANYQSQVFYPLTFLYYLLPQSAAWTAMVVLQPILGTVFMYLFATEIGITSAGSLLAALLFNFSGFANVWMEFSTVWHTILWLPLLLYIIERGVKQKSLSLSLQLLFLFGLFSAMTGGHPQDFINTFLVLLVYTTARVLTMPNWSASDKKEFILSPLLFIFAIPFFIGAVQLLPAIELFRHSARVAHDYQGIIQTMLVQWWQMPLIAVSDFFGNPATKSSITGDYVGKTLSIGVVGFVLAVAARFSSIKSWHKKFFTLTALVVLLITVRTPLSELLYRYPWPVLSTGTPTRVLFVLMLCLSVLAGFGFDALQKGNTPLKKILITVWILFALLWLFALVHPSIWGLHYTVAAFNTMKRAMIVGTLILAGATVIILAAKKQKVLLLVLIPLAAVELFYGFIKFNPFVPQSFVYPKSKLFETLGSLAGINRFWAYGTGEIEANFATQVGLYSPDGTDPLNLSWYNRLIQSSHRGNVAVTFTRTTRSDAQIATGYGKSDLPDNTYRLRLLDLLGVKYVLDRTENPKDNGTFPTNRFKLISHVDDWVIYENLKAAPRYFLTPDVRSYADTKDFETQLFDPTFDPAKTVLLAQSDFDTLPKFTVIPRSDTVHLVRYDPTVIEFTTTTDMQEFLFLSDTYDYGWTATVNGMPAAVYKTDFAFRGIVIPKGDSTITLAYAPRSFGTGLAISVITMLCTLAYFLRLLFRKK